MYLVNRDVGLALLAATVVIACTPRQKGPPIKSARGNEPFWAVTLEGEGATVRAPDLPDGITYREGHWKREGDEAKWTFKARRERAEGLWLELEITEAPCTDSMSGKAFPYKAVVTFEDKRMEGCAS